MKKISKSSLLTVISIIFFFTAEKTLAQQDTNTHTADVWDIAYLALALCVLLGLFVVVLMVYFGWKYSEKKPGKRKPISHSTEKRLEIFWILASLVLVIFATGVTFAVSQQIISTSNTKQVDTDHTIYVQAQQFQWRFFKVFPNGTKDASQELKSNLSSAGLPDLVLKSGESYSLIITSVDVIHSFFVYDLQIKQDAVPGRHTAVFIEPTKVGQYEIRCAQFCGAGHYSMAGKQFVLVV